MGRWAIHQGVHRGVRLNAPSVQQWWEGHNAALRGLVNTGQCSQHKRNTGLCNAATAHVATSQRSVPASCANSAVTLRIEAAGANPLAFWRKADCREMNGNTRNEARKKKACAWGGGEEKKQSKKKKKREKADHESEDVLSSSQQVFPFMAFVCTCRTGHHLSRA